MYQRVQCCLNIWIYLLRKEKEQDVTTLFYVLFFSNYFLLRQLSYCWDKCDCTLWYIHRYWFFYFHSTFQLDWGFVKLNKRTKSVEFEFLFVLWIPIVFSFFVIISSKFSPYKLCVTGHECLQWIWLRMCLCMMCIGWEKIMFI